MKTGRIVLACAIALSLAAVATADPLTLVDVYEPAGGVLIDNMNSIYELRHAILPTYKPATDVLLNASLELIFSRATMGNDAIVVTWSNFDDTLTDSFSKGRGFGNQLDLVIDTNYLIGEGILNVLLRKGNTIPGSSWTFLKSTLTVSGTQGSSTGDESRNTAPVPAPGTLIVVGAGVIGLVLLRRRRGV